MSPMRIWIAGVLISLGALWLLDAAGVLSAPSVLDQWWPVAIIALAVVAAVSERRIGLGPAVLFTIGVLLLFDQLGVADLGALLWPVVAILAGVWLLANRGQLHRSRVTGGDRQDVMAVLGGSATRSRSEHFRHGNVSAVFGGATLDLREAHIEPGASVDAMALFGGADVLVPPGTRVSLTGLPIFGGYDDKTRGDGELPADAPELRVSATAIFGGVSVKNFPEQH